MTYIKNIIKYELKTPPKKTKSKTKKQKKK